MAPGAAGELAPVDGGGGGDAQEVGEDRSGDLAGEVDQGAGAVGVDVVNAAGVHAPAEGVGIGGSAGVASGEQPGAGLGGEAAGAGACGGELAEVPGEGLGELDGRGAQAEHDVLVGEGEVVGGERGDPGRGLREQQDQQRGDAVTKGMLIAVQEGPGQVPAGVLVHGDDGDGPGGPGQVEPGDVPLLARPAQESSERAALGGKCEEILVQPRLVEVAQLVAVGGQPVQQASGGAQGAGGGVALAWSEPGAVVTGGASAAQQMPAGVVAQQRCWSGSSMPSRKVRSW